MPPRKRAARAKAPAKKPASSRKQPGRAAAASAEPSSAAASAQPTRGKRKRTEEPSTALQSSPCPEGPSCWQELPLELLLVALSTLEDEADLRRACCVAKGWLLACRRDSFWRPLCESLWRRTKLDVGLGGWSAYYLRRRLYERGTENLPAGLYEQELPTIPQSLVDQHQAAQQLKLQAIADAGNAVATAAGAGDPEGVVAASAVLQAAVLAPVEPPNANPDPTGPQMDSETIPDQFNKIFACAWPDSKCLLAGTKDNKLVRWNFNRNFTVIGRKTYDMADPVPPGMPMGTGGLHSISFNKHFGGDQIACGGNDPNTIMVMDYDTMQPRAQLRGNTDWMFSCCWIDKHRLVSGSRDQTVRVWSTDDLDGDPDADNAHQPPFEVRDPLLTRSEHTDKIRDMNYNLYTKQLATMSTDGMVKIWDSSNFDVISSMIMPESADLVCMASDQMESDQLVLGSRRHLTFVDTRLPTGVVDCKIVPNSETGVRSLSFRQHMVTIGCGGSHLLFYDTRMPHPHYCERAKGEVLHSGAGWIRKDTNYHFMFPEDDNLMPQGGPDAPRNAIYTHAYSECGQVLFTGGGPLQVGLFGAYGALWSRAS